MYELTMQETLVLRVCGFCRLEMHDHDRFCRHCGFNLTQGGAPAAARVLRQPERHTSRTLSPYATAPLAPPAIEGVCRRPFSAPLIRLMAAGVTSDTSHSMDGQLVKMLMLVLISLPIWLTMVLLSPLDAYATAKAVARQA